MPTFESKNDLREGFLRVPWLASPDTINTGDNSTSENDEPAHLVATPSLLENPGSPEAEALRGLQASIMLRRAGNSQQVIQIISAFPGEGKTTIAINLAIALSGQSKTCLVDADLRRPAVARSFGMSPKIGLTDVLTGTASLEAALIQHTHLRHLSILPAGAGIADAGHLFVSGSMQAVLGALRRQFQHVVIDTPPLIAYADGRALASMADGLIVIGRCGVTTREAMVQIMDLLTHINAAPIIEVVLNDVDQEPIESHYRYQMRK